MLEKLQEQNKLRVWKKFWEDTFKYLNRISSGNGKCVVYKFIGDGFILLYKPQFVNQLLPFCEGIKTYIDTKINALIREHLEQAPERVGVTIGIEKGNLIRMHLYGDMEYMGKAINAASRLQSTLKLPEHSNKLLVSAAVKEDIEDQLKERPCIAMDTILHNLYDNQEMTCYQITMQ